MTYAILDYGVNEMTMKEDLSTEADRMIETVTQLMSGQMERMLISISQGEFGVLKFLADCGKGVTSNEICRALCIGPGGVSNLLKALEKKGMIVKVHDLADRRANRVSITEQGRKKLDERYELVKGSLRVTLEGIGLRESAAINDMLIRLLSVSRARIKQS